MKFVLGGVETIIMRLIYTLKKNFIIRPTGWVPKLLGFDIIC